MTESVGTERINALDLLRGLAIILMVMSGILPRTILPDWMYHAQLPPPDHHFDPTLPGFTWVDLVFPLFLFCLGVAIPLALDRRLQEGRSRANLSFRILKRGFLLASFAIVLQHFRPFQVNPLPETGTWWFALAGFVILVLMFSRIPLDLKPRIRTILRLTGWALALIVLYFWRSTSGASFSLQRNDIIILVLANMAVFTGLIWLYSREQP